MQTPNTIKVKTSDLIDAVLDWAVAKCEINHVKKHNTGKMYLVDTPWADKHRIKWIAEYSPSNHWAQGGPIIERLQGFELKIWLESSAKTKCEAHIHNYEGDWVGFGPTPLIAAMRCFVASKLGDTVEIPVELL